MFDLEDVALLQFLVGRWQSKLPDGSPFYEEYAFTSPAELRSTRFADASFASVTDGSTVRLTEGRVVSTWGAYTWEASELSATAARFEPVRAPSSFCWLRDAEDEVRVVQEWTDDAGSPQRYELTLHRLLQID